MRNMRISVAIATYNGEKFIKEQLDSILNQSVHADEIIISDDCSTDNTLNILRKYQANNPNTNIKIITSTGNRGYIKNFYEAIKNTSGDYIFLSDQDDIWKENKIETLIGVMRNTNAKALCTNFDLIDKDGKILPDSDFRIKPFIKDCKEELKEITFKRLTLGNIAQGCTYCFKKEVKNIYVQLNSNLIEHDYQIMFIAALLGKVYFYNEKLISYRIHDNNAIGIDNKNTAKRRKFRKPVKQPPIIKFLNQLDKIVNIPNLRSISTLLYLRLPYFYSIIRR